MREHKNFWDKNAGRYDRFMRKDRAAYDEMYELIRPVVKAKTVLELATGTGLIAKHIVNAAAHIEATDASAEMIAEAKRDTRSAKLHFRAEYVLPALRGGVLRCGDRVQRVAYRAAAGESPCRDPPGAEGRRCAHRAHLYPCGKLFFRQGQGIFHEACGLPSPQQVDERGIPALPTAKRLGGAEKRCAESILPADLCGMCEIGGVIRCHFLRTPESLWGLAGKSWSP